MVAVVINKICCGYLHKEPGISVYDIFMQGLITGTARDAKSAEIFRQKKTS